jgi:DNA invertase Pin-like site-specific DNA recombinase
MLMVLSAVSEIEHGAIKDRLADGKVVWAEKGYSIGGHTPFGYEKAYEKVGNKMHTKLIPIEEEQAVLKTIYNCRKRGLGARRIAKQVSNRHPGYENFSVNKVAKIINRKFQGLPESI